MGLDMKNVTITGVNDPNRVIPASLKTLLDSSQLSFNNRTGKDGRSTGMVIDINPEDPTNTQVFTDFMSLISGDTAIFMGKPSKGMTRWIDFFRNGNLKGPNGASAMFQCVLPLSELKDAPILTGMPQASPTGQKLTGIVIRYTVYRPLQIYNVFKYKGQAWIDAMVKLYATQGINPDYLQIQGTIAPGSKETPLPRQPAGTEPQMFPWPTQWNGNTFGKPKMQMPPAILFYRNGDFNRGIPGQISVDMSPVLPDMYAGNYQYDDPGNNPKYNLDDHPVHRQNPGSGA